MRILWVEDDNPQEKKSYWFKELQDIHDIEIAESFDTAHSLIESQLDRFDYVVIDINLEKTIDSLSDVTSKLCFRYELEVDDFKREAGFHLFVELLDKGFPKDQIIFLTGNVKPNPFEELIERMTDLVNESGHAKDKEKYEEILREVHLEAQKSMPKDVHIEIIKLIIAICDAHKDGTDPPVNLHEFKSFIRKLCMPHSKIEDTYGQFKEVFKRARIRAPKAYWKGDSSTTRQPLSKWMEENLRRNKKNKDKYDYLTLRRGILNTIDILLQSGPIEVSESWSKNDKQPDDWDPQSFLRGLKWLLSEHRLPNGNIGHLYFSICDHLTKPFEKFSFSHLSRHIANERCYLLPPFFLRNWISHGLITGSNTQLTGQEATFTFILVIRSIFDTIEFGYNEELKSLFEDLEGDLLDYYMALEGKKEYSKPGKKALECIEFFGAKKHNSYWRNEKFLKHFYSSYLFSTIEQTSKALNASSSSGHSIPIYEVHYECRAFGDEYLNRVAFRRLAELGVIRP